MVRKSKTGTDGRTNRPTNRETYRVMFMQLINRLVQNLRSGRGWGNIGADGSSVDVILAHLPSLPENRRGWGNIGVVVAKLVPLRWHG